MIPLIGYEGRYSITEDGSILSHIGLSSGKFIQQTESSNGYLSVKLQGKDKRKTESVHRLVALTYLVKVSGLTHVNHKDENKKNNHVSNLEWCTPQYNTEYSVSKEFTMVSPDGEVVSIFNMAKFCRDNKLSKQCMNYVLAGKQKQHKGWTK